MGKAYEEQKRLDGEYLMQTYGRKPVEFVSGSGMNLYDDEGREYLDFLAGIAVCPLGHCHPDVVAAIHKQASKLVAVSNYFYIEHRGEVARMLDSLLSDNAPDALGNTGEGWRVFFGNSGAEANECAIKIARHWGSTHKNGAGLIVTAQKSFHGRTLATLFATGQENLQQGFSPAVEGFSYVPINDIGPLEKLIAEKGSSIAAIMLEPIQGESGVHPCSIDYLRAVRKLASDNDILFILDEVQTGLYRTGKPFAFQNYGIVPDITTIAKGFASGVPISATCAKGELGLELSAGEHGSTFGGNPLACAAALATLQAFSKEHIADNVAQVGPYMKMKLEGLPHVVDVRGMGLMVGADLDGDFAPQVVAEALCEGLVLNYTGPHTLRFLPPLIVGKDEIDVMAQRLETAIGKAV